MKTLNVFFEFSICKNLFIHLFIRSSYLFIIERNFCCNILSNVDRKIGTIRDFGKNYYENCKIIITEDSESAKNI